MGHFLFWLNYGTNSGVDVLSRRVNLCIRGQILTRRQIYRDPIINSVCNPNNTDCEHTDQHESFLHGIIPPFRYIFVLAKNT